MSGVGSQAGGFNSPHIPNQAAGPKPADKGHVAIKSVTPQTSTPTKTATKETPVKQQTLVEKVLDRQETNKQIHQEVEKQRASADSFQARTASGTSREAQQQVSKFATGFQKERELQKAKRQEFVTRVQNAKLGNSVDAKEVADPSDPAASQEEHAIANSAQSQIESLDPDAREKKKLESKLQKIFNEGGDKGKGFVAFVRREMDKGPLPDSIKELVDGFLETLRGTALTASEMVTEGNEPLITLRGVVAADNHEEHAAMQDSLAKSIITSAGERSDLMVVRNLDRSAIKVTPPKPQQSSKPSKIEKAVEFVSSINKGSLNAPWDYTGALVA